MGTVSVWDDKKVLEMEQCRWLNNTVNVLNATKSVSKVVRMVSFLLCILQKQRERQSRRREGE